MKTFVSVGIGLLVGVVIGVVASFKTAEKKADKIIRETLAEERKAMREGKSLTPIADEFEAKEKEEAEKMKNKETKLTTPDFSEVSYEEIVEEYKPAKKPYLLEDAEEDDPNYYDSHKYLDNFTEIEIVYDRDRGMVADEDGFEYDDSAVRSRIGWNNLQKLYSDDRFPRAEGMHIVDEQNGFIYLCHAGDITEFMEDYVDDDED